MKKKSGWIEEIVWKQRQYEQPVYYYKRKVKERKNQTDLQLLSFSNLLYYIATESDTVKWGEETKLEKRKKEAERQEIEGNGIASSAKVVTIEMLSDINVTSKKKSLAYQGPIPRFWLSLFSLTRDPGCCFLNWLGMKLCYCAVSLSYQQFLACSCFCWENITQCQELTVLHSMLVL